MDIIHHMTDLVLDGQLFLAPIDSNPQRILDLGTGTGMILYLMTQLLS